MASLEDFLNPNSMLTPGIAGGLATSIAVPLATNFGLSIPWLVLCASFLLSVMIVSGFSKGITLPKRSLYCVLNTMIIFSTGIGAGQQIDRRPELPPHIGSTPHASSISSPLDFLLPSAHAQASPQPQAGDGPAPRPSGLNAGRAQTTPAAPTASSAEELSRLRKQAQEYEEYRKKVQDYERRLSEYERRWKF